MSPQPLHPDVGPPEFLQMAGHPLRWRLLSELARSRESATETQKRTQEMQKELQKLQKALGNDGWHDVEGEDGTLRVKLKMVTWVKVEKDDSRVGFGIG